MTNELDHYSSLLYLWVILVETMVIIVESDFRRKSVKMVESDFRRKSVIFVESDFGRRNVTLVAKIWNFL